MNKHTPGPWSLYRTPTYWGLKHPHTGRLLATVAHSHQANSEANAALIAAAPELLAALQAILPRWDSCDEDDTPPAVVEARKAVARAVGAA